MNMIVINFLMIAITLEMISMMNKIILKIKVMMIYMMSLQNRDKIKTILIYSQKELIILIKLIIIKMRINSIINQKDKKNNENIKRIRFKFYSSFSITNFIILTTKLDEKKLWPKIPINLYRQYSILITYSSLILNKIFG